MFGISKEEQWKKAKFEWDDDEEFFSSPEKFTPFSSPNQIKRWGLKRKFKEQVTYEYNNSPHDVTGFPPACLMFGTLPYDDSPLPNQVKLNYPPIQQARQIAVNRTIKHHKINKQRCPNARGKTRCCQKDKALIIEGHQITSAFGEHEMGDKDSNMELNDFRHGVVPVSKNLVNDVLICSSDYEVLIENSQMIRNPAKASRQLKKEGIISSTDSKIQFTAKKWSPIYFLRHSLY
ncbi:hypothetical protein TNCV_4356891 [Trichonephila clavipes]|nr:hypothetical protein TNCV_4356891 [Trichonephila clavipes]